MLCLCSVGAIRAGHADIDPWPISRTWESRFGPWWSLTGVADDFTATYWNPAGLAQIKRIEFQGSLLQTGYSNSTRYYSTPWDANSNFTRLNNLGMVFPVPVYQGALTFAVGYNQVVDFEARANFRDNSGVPADGQTSQSWNELEDRAARLMESCQCDGCFAKCVVGACAVLLGWAR